MLSATSRILDQVSRARDQAEGEAILNALQSTGWNRKQAAAVLGVNYKALLYKMKKLSISRSDSTGPAGVRRDTLSFAAGAAPGRVLEPED